MIGHGYLMTLGMMEWGVLNKRAPGFVDIERKTKKRVKGMRNAYAKQAYILMGVSFVHFNILKRTFLMSLWIFFPVFSVSPP